MPMNRRDFLKVAAATAAGSALVAADPWPWAGEAAIGPIPMAMHVHSSFSEGTGSMAWQLAQARATNVPVVWWTDHDFRMEAFRYRQTIHCTSLAESENGSTVSWAKAIVGSPTNVAGTISTTDASPLDPAPPGSLRVDATAATSTFSLVRMRLMDDTARHNTHASLAGQSIKVEVLPVSIGRDAYLEVRIKLSDQPAGGGLAAGAYYLCYRIGGPVPAGSVQRQGHTGVVSIAAPVGTWSSITLTPTDDIPKIWPWLVPEDNSLTQLSVAAAARSGARATGNVDFIRFVRTTGGQIPLGVQQKIGSTLATTYAEITQHQGLEVSLYPTHLNWYGGAISLPDYGTAPLSPRDDLTEVAKLVSMIHSGGGLASYNHMFGTSFGGAIPVAQQDALANSVAKRLVANGAFGADILEVGYRIRGGVTMDRHLRVWDVCSRNALFLTGNGVSDSHEGAWSGGRYSIVTSAWAADRSLSALTGALASGRCTFSDGDRYAGSIDLSVDGTCPMGSASISSLHTRQLTIDATVPAGGTAVLVRGPVDLPGPAVTDPATVQTSVPASAFASGPVTLPIDTSASCFARIEVRDATGLVLAGSNPVWMLRTAPPGGIPPARQA